MSNLATYILSCGISPEHGYTWLLVDEEGSKEVMPNFLGPAFRVSEYIDSQKPSIILAHSNGEYLLLVTALDTSPERTDFMGRRIRNSIAWIAKAPLSDETDRLIRALAIKALSRELDELIHKAVENAPQNSQTGFSVHASTLNEILESSKKNVDIELTDDPRSFKYAYDNDKNRRIIISELRDTSLQSIKKLSGTDVLLLVTTIKSSQGFENIDVWRGLSSRVPEGVGWQEIKKKATPIKSLIDRATSIIVFLLIGILIGGIYLHNSKQESPTTPDNQDSMEIRIIPDNQDLQMEPSIIPSNQEPQKENITSSQNIEKTT